MRRRASSGFTLIEMLLSVSIIGMLTVISLPVYNTFNNRNELDIAGEQVVSALRRAQVYARGMDDDSAWSVRVQSTSVILFRGTVFGSRDTNYDETITLSSTITPSGLSEVQFAKFTAAPNTTGNIVLTSSTGASRTIAINTKGRVDY